MVENKRTDEISPYLAMGLEVTIKIRGQDFATHIRGWKQGTFILMDLPISEGDYLRVIPETTVSFRFVTGGNIFSCVSSIVSFLRQPINVMVLDFPTRYERYQLRKNLRLSSKLPAIYYKLSSVTPEERKIQHKATVLDISPTGASLISKLNLDVSSRIALSIKLSHMDKVTNIVSIVKNSTKDKKIDEDTFYLAGVEFQKIAEEDTAKIANFIESNIDFNH